MRIPCHFKCNKNRADKGQVMICGWQQLAEQARHVCMLSLSCSHSLHLCAIIPVCVQVCAHMHVSLCWTSEILQVHCTPVNILCTNVQIPGHGAGNAITLKFSYANLVLQNFLRTGSVFSTKLKVVTSL